MEQLNYPTLPKHLIVGKFYNVLCAKISNGESFLYLPIIGPIHRDKSFFKYKHVHIDFRFCGRKDIQKLHITKDGFPINVVFIDLPDSYLQTKGFEIRRKKCQRLDTRIGIPNYLNDKHDFVKWSRTMLGKSCEGKKCPHYGIKMHEKDGVLVCPLHNLMSNKEQTHIVGLYGYDQKEEL